MKREEEKQPDFKIYLTRRTFDPKTEPAIPPSDKLEHYIVQFSKSLTGKRGNGFEPNTSWLSISTYQTLPSSNVWISAL